MKAQRTIDRAKVRVRPLELPWRGRVQGVCLEGRGRADYFEYIPRRVDPGASILVAVHGISLNAAEHVELFAPQAERRGVIVVAPIFDPRHYPGFQRVGKRRNRSERLLDRIVENVRRRAHVARSGLTIFGFSGGGQFAHRYALIHPQRVRSLIIAAAGWYTFPDEAQAYPMGVGYNARYPHARCRLEQFLRIPIRVAVGARDTMRDPSLNTDPQIDHLQGRNRRERAQRWVDAMRRAARQHRQLPAVSLETLPGTGHSFRDCVEKGGLARIVFEALY